MASNSTTSIVCGSTTKNDNHIDPIAEISTRLEQQSDKISNSTFKIARNTTKTGPDCSRASLHDNTGSTQSAIGLATDWDSGDQSDTTTRVGLTSDELTTTWKYQKHDDNPGQFQTWDDRGAHRAAKLLIPSLAALIFLSLALVYTLKFCLCRRKKRRLIHQRDLVADLTHLASASQQQQRQNHGACYCFSLTSPSNTDSLLCQSTVGPPSVHQQQPYLLGWDNQLPILSDLLAAAAAELPSPTAPTGPSAQPAPTTAPAVIDTCPNGAPTPGLYTQPPRPPSYADLFGRQQTGGEHQTSSSFDDDSTMNSLIQPPPTTNNNNNNTTAAAVASQQQKNLLVKLNLNKTKLLSADDLVLLSQLLDVPIVVQQQQQSDGLPQQQQPTNHTIAEESVEEEEEDETANLENLSSSIIGPTRQSCSNSPVSREGE